mgnify:FL=1|jgi:hypothetical protein
MFDYMFISDPPILADIGSGTIGFNGLSFNAMISSTYEDDF